ncbi:MAG TPA: AMP-binding protein [Solirubrobacteraceae bacterium]|nr:AMP-binding protein [Solirubrobacteraceae bacterium]
MDWSFPLRAACERHPRRPALRHRGETLTFAQLEQRVAALAAGLARSGMTGRTVAWMLSNRPEAIELSLALARVGAVSVPLNPRLAVSEVDFLLRDAGATAVLADAELSLAAAGLAARDDALPSVAVLREHGALLVGDELAPVADEALATVLYTSGTTGFPKGVMRTHRANAWNVMNSALGSPRRRGEVELFTLPAFGIGLLHFAVPAMLGGATVVLDDAFAADRVWALLESLPATRTFLAPTMISALLAVDGHERFDLGALHTIYTAYEFPGSLRERALERFGDRFVYMYGLTEAQLTCAAPGEFAVRPDSVGGAMGAMRIRILDAQGDPVSPGTVGEIALQGPAMMSGYLHRPQETAAGLRNGWVMTGDLGRIDADGDLHYAGRSKEMIKTGGFSVDPREVERALLGVPAVQAAAVIGVPDSHWGEMVIAYVEVTDPDDFDPEATLTACRQQLAGFKLPKHLRAVDALPVNATGKIARGELRERWRREAG